MEKEVTFYQLQTFKLVYVMERIICALMLAGTLISCQGSKEVLPPAVVSPIDVSKLDLRTLEATSSSSDLKLSLSQEDGTQVTSAKNLKSNTYYRLTVESIQPVDYVIRNKEGFDVIKQKTSQRYTIYDIKTSNTLVERLYISMVPVVSEHNQLRKQAPQSFLLPLN